MRKTVGIYKQGKWFDLCRGPHVKIDGQIKAVKVLSLAGAYWRGDEKRPNCSEFMPRHLVIKKKLEQYLVRLEEAKKRDHRKLGRELEVFSCSTILTGRAVFHRPRIDSLQ